MKHNKYLPLLIWLILWLVSGFIIGYENGIANLSDESVFSPSAEGLFSAIGFFLVATVAWVIISFLFKKFNGKSINFSQTFFVWLILLIVSIVLHLQNTMLLLPFFMVTFFFRIIGTS